MSNASSKNMKLISHNTLTGFGGIGEGVSLQVTKGGRRVMWLAHEGAPKNFTGVDVTDIKNPKVICQTELPHKQMRSNSLEVCGDILAVAYQTLILDTILSPRVSSCLTFQPQKNQKQFHSLTVMALGLVACINCGLMMVSIFIFLEGQRII